ncbi:MAG: chemotaxis protein CheW, partial [Leptospiraceae bacterium]|nr:chemotaxis protein CheW [Leptospiraceae bacterium]
KNLIENISDPLLHLIRNAIDHGIEKPEQRLALGKDSKATIRLNAYHDTGSIVIEISDDGRGLDKEKILQKARANQLISTNAQLTDHDIYQLIFEPGLSTAESITNISGRGVGMDVVRKNIENMRGSIELETTPQAGTTFRIRLPLTLAIIDGFLVSVRSNFYVVPLDMVIECVELSLNDLSGGGDFLNLRGEVLPFLRLDEFFAEESEKPEKQSVIVVKQGQAKAGLVVDTLEGESQTVIKPLGKIFDNLLGISGATILGSGDVALILDVPRLIETAIQKKSASNV